MQHQELRRDDDHDDGGGAGGGPELQAAAAAADESKAVVEGALLRLAYGTEGEGATLQVNFNKIRVEANYIIIIPIISANSVLVKVKEHVA